VSAGGADRTKSRREKWCKEQKRRRGTQRGNGSAAGRVTRERETKTQAGIYAAAGSRCNAGEQCRKSAERIQQVKRRQRSGRTAESPPCALPPFQQKRVEQAENQVNPEETETQVTQ